MITRMSLMCPAQLNDISATPETWFGLCLEHLPEIAANSENASARPDREADRTPRVSRGNALLVSTAPGAYGDGMLNHHALATPLVMALAALGAAADTPPLQPNLAPSESLPAGAVQRLGESRLRHGDEVRCLAFSPDSKTLATGSGHLDGTIRLWDVATGRERMRIPSQLGTVTSLAFSPDARVLYSAGGRNFPLRIWDATTGKMLRQMALDPQWAKVYCAVLSPDGKKLITGNTNSTISAWDPATGNETARFGDREDAGVGLSFSPDGSMVVSWGTYSRIVRLWNVADAVEIRTLDVADVSTHAVFSPSGSLIVTGGLDGVVRTWSVPKGDTVAQYSGHSGKVSSVAFAPDGKTLLSAGEDETIRIWDVAAGKELRQFDKLGGVPHIVLSPDGKTLAVRIEHRSAIELWDVESGRRLERSGDTLSTWSVAIAPDDGTQVAAAELSRVRIWNVPTGEMIRTFDTDSNLRGIAMSPDHTTLFTRSRRALSVREFEMTVRAWDLNTGADRLVYRGTDAQARIAPDGSTLALWEQAKPVRLRNIETGNEIRVAEGALSRNLVTAFSPRSDRFAMATPQGEVLAWEVADGNGIARTQSGFKRVRRLGFSQNGELMACAAAWKNNEGDGAIHLLELASGQRIRTLEGHTGEVTHLAFSRSGRLLASASLDQTVRVWNLATGSEIHQFREVGSTPMCLVFSADGKRLISGMSGGGGLVWDISRK